MLTSAVELSNSELAQYFQKSQQKLQLLLLKIHLSNTSPTWK